jgi:integrase
MAKGIKKLSAVGIAKLSKPGSIHGDGGGLWLQVSVFGTRAWLFRFMLDGRARKMGLGPLHTVSLAEAREAALACRKLLREGIDPIEARKARRGALRAANARQMPFRDCASKYVAAHSAGWRSARHKEQWSQSLEAYAFPLLGDLPVDAVETAHVMNVLEPIWTAKPETASRLRGRIEAILDWATARGYRSGENPARWKGHLQNLLAARAKVAAVKHHDALPYAELPSFMAQLRALPGIDARALEFAILTAARSGEMLGAKWSEIDFAGMWTVPRERMKGHREHRVPLSDRAIAILEGLPREGELIFPLSRHMLRRSLMRIRTDCTVHGFRSTFRDWGSEQTSYPTELLELTLAHVTSSKTELAYRRGDMLEKRRRLMDDWATYCAGATAAEGDNFRFSRVSADSSGA